MLSALGAWTLQLIEQTGRFSGHVTQTLLSSLKLPFEWREISKQLERVGVQSWPVVTVTALFTGMVFTLQTFDGFKRFQAEAYVPGVLGVALLRELVPVLCCLMVAGRVGSAMAAELGTMRVTDQIDALEVMGTDPIHFLAVPRLLAAVLMMPLLITLGDLVGIMGGSLLVNHILMENMPSFLDQVFEFLDAEDYVSGMIKSAVFGAIIATTGCYQGLNTRGGAEGVGRATTKAVVHAGLGILVADFFLTKVFF